jgi:uncharacterized protein YhjY with autotransporter beta-barrel domain
VRRSLFACLLLAGVSAPALADDLSITSSIKTPVATASAANGTPGNITIQQGGSVDIAAQGAAVTLNSNNSVDNLGVIQNTYAQGGAIGVHILGGNTGTFTNEPGTATEISSGGGGANNIGVLLDGPAAFNGDLIFGSASNVVTIGTNSVGVGIEAPLNGNLFEGATNSFVGQNITGILVTAPISGSLTTSGTVGVAGTATFSAQAVDPLSGSALAIGSSINGGILNAGPTGSGDATARSNVVSTSSLPTVAILPSIAGAKATNIVIGGSSDAVNPNFSFINRGSIRDTDNDPGVSTIAVQIGETAAAAHTVTLTGGIYNNGVISAIAETDNLFAKSVPAASANATALIIGNGATINASGTTAQALLNDGTISSAITGTMPGVSTGLLIQSGGTLTSLSTSNTISATAITTDTTISGLTSYGVQDLSGKLTSITNSGHIAAIATILDNNAQQAIAIDLSHGAANETINNSGSIQGDVLFGSAGMNGAIAGNQFVIEGANASLTGALRAAPGGTIDVRVSRGGTGGVLNTSNARITSLAVGESGTVQVALNQSSATAPVISATGPVSFGFGSQVTLVPTSFLPNDGTYTLIHSNTSLTFADFAATTAQPIPYIFNGAIAQSGNDLVVTLQRKTAVQLGLTGNAAAIYEPLSQSALSDNAFGSALLTLTNAQDVQTAINSAVPDIGGGVRALAIAITDSATGIVGARQRALVLSPANQQEEFRFWAQEVYDQVSAGSTAVSSGYSGAGQGIAVGVEWGALPSGRAGVAFTFFASQESEAHPADNRTDGDWHVLSFYAGWRPGNFFLAPEINIGQANYNSRRGISIENALTRTATASWSGYLGSAALTTGYVIPMGAIQIVPELSFDGLYLRDGAYNEQGATSADLSVKSQDQRSVRGFAGVIAQGTFAWDAGTIQPQLLLGWSYDFLHKPGVFNGTFEGAPNSPFQLTGPDVEANRLIGGLGVSYAVGNWSAAINYDAALSTGSVGQSATFSLSSRF